MPQLYDVVVIGSGLGGMIVAALLARAGRNTLLIERNHSLGVPLQRTRLLISRWRDFCMRQAICKMR